MVVRQMHTVRIAGYCDSASISGLPLWTHDDDMLQLPRPSYQRYTYKHQVRKLKREPDHILLRKGGHDCCKMRSPCIVLLTWYKVVFLRNYHPTIIDEGVPCIFDTDIEQRHNNAFGRSYTHPRYFSDPGPCHAARFSALPRRRLTTHNVGNFAGGIM